MTDNELLEGFMRELKGGNRDALDGIYRITAKGVYLLAYSILRNAESARDVMQDTFLRVAANIDKYEPQNNAKAWVLIIARNIGYREYANAKRNAGSAALEQLADARDYASQWTDNAALAAVLNTLTTEEREIVTLFAIDGYKHREIAEIVSRPAGTVRWLYNRAINRLRKQMEAHDEK
ncbi:MAG: RNA polymerase sigma factor [Clostridiaceae bacterium]|jgi:RNA polymerase sigma-70 factor (ECF subfamily)|nr:RNA polymerase sigma factor [Clostridiaceae bacterium]